MSAPPVTPSPTSTEAIGPASSQTATERGTRTVSAQVSSAEDTRDASPSARPEVARDERHRHGGQGATGGDLVEHVGHGIHRLVDLADARRTDAVREDEGADEPGGTREDRHDGDEPRGGRDALGARAHVRPGPSGRARGAPASTR